MRYLLSLLLVLLAVSGYGFVPGVDIGGSSPPGQGSLADGYGDEDSTEADLGQGSGFTMGVSDGDVIPFIPYQCKYIINGCCVNLVNKDVPGVWDTQCGDGDWRNGVWRKKGGEHL